MNQLTHVLQRNLRVRYEINIPDVVQACVPSEMPCGLSVIVSSLA